MEQQLRAENLGLLRVVLSIHLPFKFDSRLFGEPHQFARAGHRSVIGELTCGGVNPVGAVAGCEGGRKPYGRQEELYTGNPSGAFSAQKRMVRLQCPRRRGWSSLGSELDLSGSYLFNSIVVRSISIQSVAGVRRWGLPRSGNAARRLPLPLHFDAHSSRSFLKSSSSSIQCQPRKLHSR